MKNLNIPEGSKVLDLGCGNGRIYELLKNVDYYGLDISSELIKHAKNNVPNGHFIVGDMVKTNYQNNKFDFVISAAVLHHIPSKELRNLAIKEIYRVTKPGGKILITNWYFWNKPKYLKKIIKSTILNILGKSNLDPGDFYMVWKNNKREKITERYFHPWRIREINNCLKKTKFINIKSNTYFRKKHRVDKNLISIAQKPL